MISFTPKTDAEVTRPSQGAYALFLGDGGLSLMDFEGNVSIVGAADAEAYELPEQIVGRQFLGGFMDGTILGPNCILKQLAGISSREAFSLSTTTPTPILDAAANQVSLANGAAVSFANFSGVVAVNDFGVGAVSLYLCGGGVALALGSSVPTGITAAYSSGISGYIFTNTSGGTRIFTFMALRTRGSS